MNRVRRQVADLHPGYAALVMATGIVSTGLEAFGWDALSDALLAVAVVALVVLAAAYVWRAVAYPRRLLAVGDHLGVHRALGEEPVGVGLLEVLRADLRARDVRGDREHRDAGAVGVVQPVDQVQVPRPARPGADGQPPRELSLGGGGEGPGLLVADLHPLDALGAADGIDHGVQAVADDAVDVAHAGGDELVDELISDGLRAGHDDSSG